MVSTSETIIPPPHAGRDEVLRRLLAGQTYKQIAAAMGITPGGVGVVANKIYRIHGVRNRRELQEFTKTTWRQPMHLPQ